MADRKTPVLRLPVRPLLSLLIGLAFASRSHAEIKITPSASVQGTWTDNVGLAPADQARSEFVTELGAGLRLTDKTPRLQLDASYAYHAFFYSDKDVPNLRSNSSELQGTLHARVVDELLFVDANAARSQQAVSAFGAPVAENPYSSANRTDVSIWRVSPYLTRRIGNSASLVARYTLDAVSSGFDGYGNSRSDSSSVVLNSVGDRHIGWYLQTMRQHLSDDVAGESTSSTALAGLSWRLRQGLSLTGSIGYDEFDYHSLSGPTRGRSWSVGLAYTPSERTSLSASVGRRYFGDSRALSFLHRSRHTVWNISYDQAVTTSRQQFVLPATVDTASLLDRLFVSSYPDPELRRQAIAAYMQASGLPSSLANNVNFLSNRYFLQKQFMASVAWRGARSTLVVSAMDTRRTALSVQEVDSPLLGNSLSNLYDDVHQRSYSSNFSYRLGANTDAFAVASVSRAETLDTHLEQTNRALRVGVQRRFQRRLLGSAEVRRLQGAYAANQAYTENAVSATLSMTF